ncbi:hypothetical protein HZB01_04240 [Candidatus Woesearchaeota archaeon]|nr:hypothetical protein [Candidatus Woesearchaeota archaeon]
MIDLESRGHEKKGVPNAKDCLMYSHFPLPATLCEGCKDEMQALWYGAQLRTGRQHHLF